MQRTLLALLLLATTCAQAQWTQRASNTAQALYAVHFPDDHGYAVGYGGTVIESADRGQSWSAVPFPNTGDLQGVWFLSAAEGFVVGDSGMYRTENEGNSWTPVPTPVQLPWRDIRFISPLIGFCGGGDFGQGTILRTQDGGNTWAVVHGGGDQPIAAIQFPTADVGYAVLFGYSWSVLKTTDGGNTWTTMPLQPIENFSSLEAVYFTDANTGYVAGWYLAAFVRTNDGGTTWSEAQQGLQFNAYDIDFASPTNGFSVGWEGAIHHTTNGLDWTDESWTASNNVLYAVHMLDDTAAVVVGDNGMVLRYAAGPTSIHAVAANNAHITVYPSPATDWLTLDAIAPLPPDTRFELHDASGRMLKEWPARLNERIALVGISAGTYLWRCVARGSVLASGTLVVGR